MLPFGRLRRTRTTLQHSLCGAEACALLVPGNRFGGFGGGEIQYPLDNRHGILGDLPQRYDDDRPPSPPRKPRVGTYEIGQGGQGFRYVFGVI